MKPHLESDAKTFGDWSYLAIAKHFKKTIKHEKEVLKDENPEQLHQMRVGMRRLRSAIVGFSPALNLPPAADEKKVGKIARILGQLRDIDVLGEILKNQYQPVLPTKEQKQLNKALDVLAEQRVRAFERVDDILKDKLYLNLKTAFQDWLKNPSYQTIAEISIGNILPDLLLPQISKLLLQPGWILGIDLKEKNIQVRDRLTKEQVKKLLDNQGTLLHELRKEAKRSRYNMELFTQFYGDNYQDYLTDIKALQAVLGDIQDSFVLAEFLTEAFEKEFSNKMPVLAEQLTETRYEKWQEWQELQHRFLDKKTRKDLHITILQPIEIENFETERLKNLEEQEKN
ncbi:CHAD domain-containing protein [Candidatus Gracilibacteria bacterium]|nr:CHAD domain-containing protein [Candidatus Gracilibacteria bacterium]NJM86527.1 CHAD domain-containing protein [Hydrococcus sp. RU_2_2]NJP22178.1 CHAD domain-containing protein [Hydrococcus sp. CRU_1_1]